MLEAALTHSRLASMGGSEGWAACSPQRANSSHRAPGLGGRLQCTYSFAKENWKQGCFWLTLVMFVWKIEGKEQSLKKIGGMNYLSVEKQAGQSGVGKAILEEKPCFLT